MADLSSSRVSVARPFTHTDVDYAGPILIKEHKRRNAKLCKAYIAVFVCFTVRAVHLEIVSNLTTKAFIGALKRFISRRDRPKSIYSDNGTNFVGAKKYIKEMYALINNENSRKIIGEFVSELEIKWKFIPLNAPHFGGFWEAAVKLTKTHINRVLENAHLTFKEMQTTLCEIEAILNSRPLAPFKLESE
ncbi:uncharacterized protein [Cardiocondyla obscurior]|uniref:uncharacterized protein n=1 Tax=Cardiocondyla obscurior TaxID=286306 RepID=UPI003965676E